MLTTPVFGLQYAQGADPAKQYPAAVDAPSKLKIEAQLLKGVPIFASAAARDAAIPSPVEGQLCYLADWNMHMGHNGAGWGYVAGANPSASLTFPTTSLAVTPSNVPARFATATSGLENASWAGMGGSHSPAAGRIYVPVQGRYEVTAFINAAPTAVCTFAMGAGSSTAYKSYTQHQASQAAPMMFYHRYETYLVAQDIVCGWYATNLLLPLYSAGLTVRMVGIAQ